MAVGRTWWRRRLLTFFIPLILCECLIFYAYIFQLQSLRISTATSRLIQPRYTEYSEDSALKGFLIKTEGCRIPEMHPFDPSVSKYIFIEDPIVCNNDKPPLIESNLTSLYLLRISLPSYGISDISALECCYSVFKRVVPSPQQPDNKVSFSEECIKFNYTAKISDEYIRVFCWYNGSKIYKDFFAFVPIKSKVKDNLITKRPSPVLNVLIIGVDSVSRLNLHRLMPKTVQMLQELTAVDLMGYNKVGNDTFRNLIPMLTGLTEDELVKKCWPNKNGRFDDCPFIWKNFSENGFATAFGEDSTWMGIFNYNKRGFKNQPTDYFWGPYNYIAEHQIGNKHSGNVFHCVGARLVYNVLLEYIDKFVRTMHINKISNFGFFWGSSLSHDFLNIPQLGDDDYANFLNELRTNEILNDTALIFMSDHGIRWGGIRTTYQGRMEERLPVLFIALPEWYRDTHHQAFINLRRNTRRLATPFDLHETLKDLLNPHTLTQEVLNARFENRAMKRGYSLFEPIPTNRRCEDAAILSAWCACQRTTNIDKNNTVVVKVAKFTVDYINNKLKGYADCANLSLAEIYNARLHTSVWNTVTQDYTVAFRTIPGDAIFEATVRKYIPKTMLPKNFTASVLQENISHSLSVIGTISRTNLYGKQSLCITDFHLKLYCYCKGSNRLRDNINNFP